MAKYSLSGFIDDMGTFQGTLTTSFLDSKMDQALREINDMRAHDGLAPWGMDDLEEHLDDLKLVRKDPIEGIFIKQVWGGRTDDQAITIGEETFDATRYVLGMTLNQLHAITDNDDTSDDIGTAHVDHDGPYYVEITDAICGYFGVEVVEDITQEMLDEARQDSGFIFDAVQEASNTIKLRLILDVEYDFREVPSVEVERETSFLKKNLEGLFLHAMDAYPSVVDYSFKVDDITPTQDQEVSPEDVIRDLSSSLDRIRNILDRSGIMGELEDIFEEAEQVRQEAQEFLDRHKDSRHNGGMTPKGVQA